jgi:hypothetical protein
LIAVSLLNSVVIRTPPFIRCFFSVLFDGIIYYVLYLFSIEDIEKWVF